MVNFGLFKLCLEMPRSCGTRTSKWCQCCLYRTISDVEPLSISVDVVLLGDSKFDVLLVCARALYQKWFRLHSGPPLPSTVTGSACPRKCKHQGDGSLAQTIQMFFLTSCHWHFGLLPDRDTRCRKRMAWRASDIPSQTIPGFIPKSYGCFCLA